MDGKSSPLRWGAFFNLFGYICDRGGIGVAQYNAVQNAAEENRR